MAGASVSHNPVQIHRRIYWRQLRHLHFDFIIHRCLCCVRGRPSSVRPSISLKRKANKIFQDLWCMGLFFGNENAIQSIRMQIFRPGNRFCGLWVRASKSGPIQLMIQYNSVEICFARRQN